MALSDTKLKNLKPKQKAFSTSDGGGLLIEVMPGGKKVWRLRYRLNGIQEKVSLGEYPYHTLTDARQWREECRQMVTKGNSPMKAKRKAKASQKEPDEVKAFANIWMQEVVEKTTKNPRNIRRVLDKDIIPAIGNKRLSEVAVSDVLAITDRIKARGSDHVALLTRNVMKKAICLRHCP